MLASGKASSGRRSRKEYEQRNHRQRAQTLNAIYKNSLTKPRLAKQPPRSTSDENRTKTSKDMATSKAEHFRRNIMSPFSPLPAIRQSANSSRSNSADTSENCKTSNDETVPNLFLFDFNNEHLSPGPRNLSSKLGTLKIHSALTPQGVKEKVLSPLNTNTLRKNRNAGREVFESSSIDKPLQLLRENTYEVIDPMFVSGPRIKKRDSSISRRRLPTPMVMNVDTEVSDPKSRFKKAAMEVVKLSTVPETGRLLSLRQKEKYSTPAQDRDVEKHGKPNDLELESPKNKLNKLSEIFQSLQVQGRCREKAKKENNWF